MTKCHLKPDTFVLPLHFRIPRPDDRRMPLEDHSQRGTTSGVVSPSRPPATSLPCPRVTLL